MVSEGYLQQVSVMLLQYGYLQQVCGDVIFSKCGASFFYVFTVLRSVFTLLKSLTAGHVHL